MEEKMTFWAHLEDLRWSLVRVVAVLFVFVVVCFCLMPYLFDNFVLAPHHVRFPALQMAVETGRRQPAAPRFQQRPLLGRTHQHQRSLAVPDAYQHFVLVCACTDIPLPDVRNMAVRTTCPVRQRKRRASGWHSHSGHSCSSSDVRSVTSWSSPSRSGF